MAIAALVLTLIGASACRDDSPESIAIVMLGDVDEAVSTVVVTALQDRYNVEITEIRADELPEEAFYEPRGRYRADKLLDYLAETNRDVDRVIGLTAVDISTTKGEHEDWGIFGLARLPGRAAVVSTFRLLFDEPDEQLLASRLTKVSIHEIGHTLGLRHCEVATCVMRSAAGKVATVDETEDELCDSCAGQVAHHLHQESAP